MLSVLDLPSSSPPYTYICYTFQIKSGQPIVLAQSTSQTTGQSLPQVANKSVVIPTSASSVPHLTEQQKRIVAEFKQKMAELPPEQQAQYIAQHKSALVKQLNFQPTQLELLRSSHQQQQQLQQVIFDPRGRSTAMAGSDHHFRTWYLYVRPSVCPPPTFQNLAKQNHFHYWRDCGSVRVDH